MRATHWTPQGMVELVDVEVPEPPPGWVRVEVAACGICGSDLHGYGVANHNTPGGCPGHEAVGYADAAGEGSDVELGRLVAIEPLVTCNECAQCRSGHFNRCRSRQLIGGQAPGGLADHVLVPAARLHPMPDGFDANLAALTEPMAVCVRGVQRGNVQGKKVAIIGAGSIGLITIPAAFAAGAAEVHVLARHPHQVELAEHLGATAVHRSLDSLGPESADVVIETVGGMATTLVDAADLAVAGGTIVKLGVFVGTTPIPSIPFLDKELTLVASLCYSTDAGRGDFATAVDVVVERAHELEPLITHRFPLSQVGEAFATAADKSNLSIKVQLTP